MLHLISFNKRFKSKINEEIFKCEKSGIKLCFVEVFFQFYFLLFGNKSLMFDIIDFTMLYKWDAIDIELIATMMRQHFIDFVLKPNQYQSDIIVYLSMISWQNANNIHDKTELKYTPKKPQMELIINTFDRIVSSSHSRSTFCFNDYSTNVSSTRDKFMASICVSLSFSFCGDGDNRGRSSTTSNTNQKTPIL